MKTLSIRSFTRNQGYRHVTEPVALVSGQEVLGTFLPIEWEREKAQRDLRYAILFLEAAAHPDGDRLATQLEARHD